MTKTSQGRTSALTFDGAETLTLNSGRMTFATAADSNNGRFMVPWDATIEALYYQILTTSTATGTRELNVGSATDSDAFVDAVVVSTPTAKELRQVDLTATDGTVPDRTVPAGTELQFELGAGVAGGVVSATLVLSPNA